MTDVAFFILERILLFLLAAVIVFISFLFIILLILPMLCKHHSFACRCPRWVEASSHRICWGGNGVILSHGIFVTLHNEHLEQIVLYRLMYYGVATVNYQYVSKQWSLSSESLWIVSCSAGVKVSCSFQESLARQQYSHRLVKLLNCTPTPYSATSTLVFSFL